MADYLLVIIILIVIILWLRDLKEEWMSWYMHRLTHLRMNQLEAMGFSFKGINDQNEICYLFNNHFIFKIHHNGWFFVRIYIVDRKYLEMKGTMDMNIKNISRQHRKWLYKNIQRSLKEESYLVDTEFPQQLYEEITRCYQRYIRMRLMIYGGK